MPADASCLCNGDASAVHVQVCADLLTVQQHICLCGVAKGMLLVAHSVLQYACLGGRGHNSHHSMHSRGLNGVLPHLRCTPVSQPWFRCSTHVTLARKRQAQVGEGVCGLRSLSKAALQRQAQQHACLHRSARLFAWPRTVAALVSSPRPCFGTSRPAGAADWRRAAAAASPLFPPLQSSLPTVPATLPLASTLHNGS